MPPAPPIPPASADAALEYSRGELSSAEYLARIALMENPRDANACFILARLALDWNLPDFAERYAKRALEINPYLKSAKKALDEATRLAAGRAPPSAPTATSANATSRVLLIKCWGTGFWSDVRHVLGQLVLADVAGRTPVIHWGERSRFLPGDGSEGWRNFFDPVSPLGLDDLRGKGLSIYPPCWNENNVGLEKGIDRAANLAGPWDLYCLNRPDDVVVSNVSIGMWDIANWIPPTHPWHGLGAEELLRRAMQKWLRPVAPVLEAVERFASEHFARRPGKPDAAVIALHLRGTDKVMEDPDLAAKNEELVRRAGEKLARNPAARLFLLTDTVKELAAARKRWGDALTDPAGRVLATDCYRSPDNESIHFQPRENPDDGVRFGREVLVDALLASRCDELLGVARSNVTCMIAAMKEWPAGALTLLGPTFHFPQRIAEIPKAKGKK